MIVHVIHCGIPKCKGTASTTSEFDVFVVYVNRDLTDCQLRKELSHELCHVLNDDFHKGRHVNSVENTVRKTMSDDDFESIDFYHHYLDKDDNPF